MVKITNGKDVLIVPTNAYNEIYKNTGWQYVARKKRDDIVDTTKIETNNNTVIQQPVEQTVNKRQKRR